MNRFHEAARAALRLALLVAAIWGWAGIACPHAGHSHGPEATAPAVADVAPRFYSQSEKLQVVLAFPPVDRHGRPALYIADVDTNEPIESAEVAVDVLTGPQSKVKVAAGETSGTYILQGLAEPSTTMSLTVEVSKGDLLEILTIDNVLIDPEKKPAAATDTVHPEQVKVEVFGMPVYVLQALLAINAIIAAVVIGAVVMWLLRKVRRPRAAPMSGQPGDVPVDKTALLVLLFLGAAGSAFSHAGDEHRGVGFDSAAGMAGSHRFMPIDAQFEGEVLTTRVVEKQIPKSFRALGQVEVRSDKRAVVTAPVEGRLVAMQEKGRVPVQGEEVQKGQVLVVVEQVIPVAEKVTIATERSQVESELSQARQQLELAVRERDRAERLARVISAKEVEDARANVRIAQDRVTGLQRRLETLTNALSGAGPNVREVSILSPIAGTITLSHAVLGEYVRTDKTLFEIVNLEEVFVGADVFETDLALVRDAKTARITVEAYPNRSFSGTLHAISQEIDPQTRTAHVLFAVENADELLRGGMFANIEIQSDESRAALVVPKAAVVSQDGIRQVFRKTGPETFAAQVVDVSEFREDVAVIDAGLKTGDRVAISGLYQISMSPMLPASGTEVKP